MPLLLRVAGPSEAEGERLVEVDALLRIGRAPDNDLVLADEERLLSKTHCVIRHEAGRYVVLDSSTNGTFVNGAPERLRPGETAVLRPGDAIGLGRFTLSVVSIIFPDRGGDPVAPRADLLGPVSNAPAPLPVETPTPSPGPFDSFPGATPGGGLEAFLGERDSSLWRLPRLEQTTQPDHSPADEDSFRNVVPSREAIPEDWNPLAEFRKDANWPAGPSAFASQPLSPAPMPSARPSPDRNELPEREEAVPIQPAERVEGAHEIRRGLAGMFAACGLDAGGMTDDEALVVAERAGRILHIAVEGMLRILGSRSIAKQEFRIERTAITRGANNPMKFTASADEALRLLLHSNVPGFLPPEDAVRETMRDIQDYQLTLLAGVRSAVDEVLRRLDPTTIETAMPRQTGDALGVVRKAHAWDAFRSAFARLQQSLSDERGELFGEALGRAYAANQRRPGLPKEGSP